MATCLQVGSELELPLDTVGFAVRCAVSLSYCNRVSSEARGLRCCQGVARTSPEELNPRLLWLAELTLELYTYAHCAVVLEELVAARVPLPSIQSGGHGRAQCSCANAIPHWRFVSNMGGAEPAAERVRSCACRPHCRRHVPAPASQCTARPRPGLLGALSASAVCAYSN